MYSIPPIQPGQIPLRGIQCKFGLGTWLMEGGCAAFEGDCFRNLQLLLGCQLPGQHAALDLLGFVECVYLEQLMIILVFLENFGNWMCGKMDVGIKGSCSHFHRDGGKNLQESRVLL